MLFLFVYNLQAIADTHTRSIEKTLACVSRVVIYNYREL